MLLGHYPEAGVNLLEAAMLLIGAEDMKLIAQPIDFTDKTFTVRPWSAWEHPGERNLQGVQWTLPKQPWAGMWILTVCIGLLNFCGNVIKKPIYITGNDMSCHDWVSLGEKMHAPAREDHLHPHLL